MYLSIMKVAVGRVSLARRVTDGGLEWLTRIVRVLEEDEVFGIGAYGCYPYAKVCHFGVTCRYVDKECLDSVRKNLYPSAAAAGRERALQAEGFAVLIDSDFGHRPPPKQEEPDSEEEEAGPDGLVGRTSKYDVAWMYVRCGNGFVGIYDSRSAPFGGWDETWRLFYERPSPSSRPRQGSTTAST
jgi:hypothetical protein